MLLACGEACGIRMCYLAVISQNLKQLTEMNAKCEHFQAALLHLTSGMWQRYILTVKLIQIYYLDFQKISRICADVPRHSAYRRDVKCYKAHSQQILLVQNELDPVSATHTTLHKRLTCVTCKSNSMCFSHVARHVVFACVTWQSFLRT